MSPSHAPTTVITSLKRGGGCLMRIAITAAITCLSMAGLTATAQVHAAVRQHTEIPAESLDLALRTLAKDRGFQLVYLTENVAPLKTGGAMGDFTVDEALKRL